MNPYRQKLAEVWFKMIEAETAIFNTGIDISRLDELKDLQDEDFTDEFLPAGMLETMKDPMVLRISAFVNNAMELINKLDDYNNFLDEELESFGEPKTLPRDEKVDKEKFLGLICYFIEEIISPQLKSDIQILCTMSNVIPVADNYKAQDCEDENVQVIAAFFVEAWELRNDIAKAYFPGLLE